MRPLHHRKFYYLNVFDVAVLLLNAWLAANDKGAGLLDADIRPEEFMNQMRRDVAVDEKDCERLAYAAQMMHERDKFWHPTGKPWPEYVQRVFSDYEFDTLFCSLTKKKENRG